MADRPRLLLVPMVSEIEWGNRPDLEQWADVAAFDAPGVGDEPPAEDFGEQAIAERGLAELDRLGWDHCFVAADEFGIASATLLATLRPDAIAGLALGHARLSNSTEGARAPMDANIFDAYCQLAAVDYRAWARQLMKMTGGERSLGGYGEELGDSYIERVPQNVILDFLAMRGPAGARIDERLRSLEVPLFLAKHDGCLLFTAEGFEDACGAFPEAHSMSFPEKPSTSAAFAEALRTFCAENPE